MKTILVACVLSVIAQPCSAQLRSILQTEAGANRVANLSDEPSRGSYPFEFDKIVANQPSAPASVYASEQFAPTVSVRRLEADKRMPANITSFEVKNGGTIDAHNVNVELSVEYPSEILSVVPKTTVYAGRSATVKIPKLAAGATDVIHIEAVSANGMNIDFVAKVMLESIQKFSDGQEVDTNQSEDQTNPPRIMITGPDQIDAGSTHTFVATIQNPSIKLIRDLEIQLKTNSDFIAAPNSKTVLNLPELAPRHVAKFAFELTSTKSGIVELGFEATGRFTKYYGSPDDTRIKAEKLQLSSVKPIHVYEEKLQALLSGPTEMMLGAESDFTIKVTNTSERPLRDVQVTMDVPEGLDVSVLDRVADMDANRAKIYWTVPYIAIDHSEIIRFKAVALHSGEFQTQVAVGSNENNLQRSDLITEISGKPNLGITIKDSGRTEFIGKTTNLSIVVDNQDAKTNRNLQVQMIVPQGVRVFESDLFQAGTDRVLRFYPFALGRGEQKELPIQIVSDKPGSVTIMASLISSDTQEPETVERQLIFTAPRQAKRLQRSYIRLK